ncbi:MAG TPA: ADP-ribosylglycohydrolase family protein [Phycisphaerae bacterium]|nr:ADP-ribosylglycohydrolase family protein [Phycisphaerae bacterium]HOM53264.1 ADP-ribosylglycohydrolase family protein [Phycisphaerae bacterium]HOQ87051.1 ADP-ribosylglycohydrolase family protein [Phycisphaerae bacterium]HPP28357.1 ADP-ribosylglycohydrolase family protein [Phycisphaerae bacterium]HPU26222.1 ADP-ribosylglycohydrolase family protein [Phycisphaerae bacterium]
MMKRVVMSLLIATSAAGWVQAAEYRRLPVSEYRDKMKAGWLGQMAGVAWGAPTEFKWKGAIIPADKVPAWQPEMINDSFWQDDLYVDMTFLRTLEVYGLGVSIRQAGIDFANSGYQLWHANKAGRDALRAGIAPPDSGHPQFNKHADDIDYQIEADFAGLVSPGLPNTVIALGEKFGRLMNYGDGLYGGQFVGGMYAEAFFEKDPVKLVEAGLACIPPGSQYAECVRDVLAWYRENPNDWEATWRRIEEKYQDNPAYRKASCDKGDFNIDAKINGAYIVLGMLYGKGDLDQTIVISMRAGQDSDCNPSNAAGVLFTTLGFSNVPEKFKEKLDEEKYWVYTEYNFAKLIAACEKVAREAVVQSGGRIEKDADGQEVFVLPVTRPVPSKLEQCWNPGPIAGSRFTAEEMARINPPPPPNEAARIDINEAVAKFAPGWMAKDCGAAMSPGIRDVGGRKNVLVTHPISESMPCVLGRRLDVLPDKKTTLHLEVGHHPEGDWLLSVTADRELVRKVIGPETTVNGWTTIDVDLSEYAGEIITVQLINAANGWKWEAAYWGKIEIRSE